MRNAERWATIGLSLHAVSISPLIQARTPVAASPRADRASSPRFVPVRPSSDPARRELNPARGCGRRGVRARACAPPRAQVGAPSVGLVVPAGQVVGRRVQRRQRPAARRAAQRRLGHRPAAGHEPLHTARFAHESPIHAARILRGGGVDIRNPPNVWSVGRTGRERGTARMTAGPSGCSIPVVKTQTDVRRREPGVVARRGVVGLERRDPRWAELTVPVIWPLLEDVVPSQVRGLERIPATGPVLLVGNHSGGNVAPDTLVFTAAFIRRFGAQRPFFQLAHELVVAAPWLAPLRRYGTVTASPENARAALAEGAAVLVYPGGDWEAHRPVWQGHRVDFHDRHGFIRLALESGAPLVPVVSIGGQEHALFLSRGELLVRKLRLHRRLRLSALPISIASSGAGRRRCVRRCAAPGEADDRGAGADRRRRPLRRRRRRRV